MAKPSYRKKKIKSSVKSDSFFDVEKVLDKKKIKNQIKYFIKWQGYSE